MAAHPTLPSLGHAVPPAEMPPTTAGDGEAPPSSSDYDSADEWADAAARGPAVVAPPTVKDYAAVDDAERELAGASVVIVFRLPEGSDPATVRRVYPQGQTISYLKGHLEDLYGLPYDRTTLTLGGMWLMDPLSLNDLPFRLDGVENIVDVSVAPVEA